MLYPIFRGPFPWKKDTPASGEPEAEPGAEAEAEAVAEPEAESGRRLERGLEEESWGRLQAA